MSKPNGYSKLQITLHWAIALLIIATYLTGDGMGRVLRDRIEQGDTGIAGNTVHVWLGGLVFLLVLIRIIVRLKRGAPDHVEGTSTMMAKAATLGHWLLYALMVLAPAAGAAAWYGHVGAAGDAHETIVNALLIVALGHALIALVHHYVWKDGTLTRMMRSE